MFSERTVERTQSLERQAGWIFGLPFGAAEKLQLIRSVQGDMCRTQRDGFVWHAVNQIISD
jgi:hypothetical protein